MASKGRRRPSGQEIRGEAGISSGKASRLSGLGVSSHDTLPRADWGEALPELMASVVVSITRLGGLASFGRTSKGNALSLTLFLDDEKTTVYINPDMDVDAELEKVVVYLDAIQ